MEGNSASQLGEVGILSVYCVCFFTDQEYRRQEIQQEPYSIRRGWKPYRHVGGEFIPILIARDMSDVSLLGPA